MRRHLLTIAVILTAAPGCDNVTWGSIDVKVVPPPATTNGAQAAAEDPEAAGPVNLDGPVLSAGLRDGPRATLVVVGEVDGDVLTPFPDPAFSSDQQRLQELTAPGARWVLFSEGARVGSMIVDATGEAEGFCGPRATISGIVELVPPAAAAERLLALPAEDAMARSYGEYQQLNHVYDQRVASLEAAQRAIPEHGAQWPERGVLDARKHIQAFDLPGDTGPYVAATFVYRDSLGVTPPGQGAYALLVVAEQVGDAYDDAYVWYRAVDTEGKGAPRYFDHLDWDGDGTEEMLLDVLGSNRRWFAGVSQREGTWIRTFQDECGSGSTAGS